MCRDFGSGLHVLRSARDRDTFREFWEALKRLAEPLRVSTGPDAGLRRARDGLGVLGLEQGRGLRGGFSRAATRQRGCGYRPLQSRPREHSGDLQQPPGGERRIVAIPHGSATVGRLRFQLR